MDAHANLLTPMDWGRPARNVEECGRIVRPRAIETRPKMSTRAGPVMEWWIAEQFESSYSQEEEDNPPSEPEIDPWDIKVVIEDVEDNGEVVERRAAVEESVEGDPDLVSPLTPDGGSVISFNQERGRDGDEALSVQKNEMGSRDRLEGHGGSEIGTNSGMPLVPQLILCEQPDDLDQSALKSWARNRGRSKSISSQRSSKSCTEQLVALSLQGSLMTSRLSPTSGFSSRSHRSRSVSSMTRSLSPQEFEDGLIPVLAETTPAGEEESLDDRDLKRPRFWTRLTSSKDGGYGKQKRKRMRPSYY
ncbi:hypothetical protein QBC44DRAFT_310016 [Cladorrhinum sp. PSN332]|nr:hypothetical protein QBC44DRAFT_310016 [Cladorrhinum sp. PSN332]